MRGTAASSRGSSAAQPACAGCPVSPTPSPIARAPEPRRAPAARTTLPRSRGSGTTQTTGESHHQQAQSVSPAVFTAPIRARCPSFARSGAGHCAVSCWRAGLRSVPLARRAESDRMRHMRKLRRTQFPQRNQHLRPAKTLAKRPQHRIHPRKQRRQKPLEQNQAMRNQTHTKMRRTPRTRQIQRFPATTARRRVHTPRLRQRDRLLHIRQRTRKTRGKAVRKGAERRVTRLAVPTRYPHAARRHPAIGTMTRTPAGRDHAPQTRRRTCLTPCPPANVLFGGQSTLVAKLQWPSTAYGPASVSRGPTSSTQRRPNPPPRIICRHQAEHAKPEPRCRLARKPHYCNRRPTSIKRCSIRPELFRLPNNAGTIECEKSRPSHVELFRDTTLVKRLLVRRLT